MAADVWTLLDDSADRVRPQALYNSVMSTPVLCSLAVGLALLGLAGNGLAYRTCRHPHFKDSSFRVYLAYLAVVDSLDLTLTLLETLSVHFRVTAVWMGVDDLVCKAYSGFRSWIGDLSSFGLLGLVLDRYIAFVLTRFRHVVCTFSNAQLICAAFSFLTVFINIPYSSTFRLAVSRSERDCLENFDQFFYVTYAFTSNIPCLVELILTSHHLCLLYCCRQSTAADPHRGIRSSSSSSSGSSTTATTTTRLEETEKKTRGPLVVLGLASVAMRLPGVILEPIKSTAQNNHLAQLFLTYHEERFKNIKGAEQICDMVNCVSLVCNFYVLCVTSPFFRGCVRDVCQRGALSRLEEVIQLPEDRRELTLIAEGRARETTTGQVVDLNQFNQQREHQELVKQQSASDSISSTVSSITVLSEHGQAASSGAHPRTKTQAHSNKGPHPESLDRIAERTESKGGKEEEAVGPSDPATLSLTSSSLQNHPDGTTSTHAPRQQKAQTPPTCAANEGQKSPDCCAKNPTDRVTSPAGVPEQPPHRTGNQTEPSPDREDPKSPQNESHGKEEECGAAAGSEGK